MGDSLNPNNLQLLWDDYAMASINYRLAGPDAVWPAQIQDCKAAIRWLRAHAKEYGYDPNRIGVIGESAGGHLVAMLGATSGDKTFDVGENLGVACVVNLFGVSDFTLPMPAVATNVAALLGGPAPERPELARSASPINYVHANEPPMLVVHGTADRLVLTSNPRSWSKPWKKSERRSIFIPSWGAATIRILASLTTPRRAILMRAGEVSACLKTRC